jgi:hypothetical protein
VRGNFPTSVLNNIGGFLRQYPISYSLESLSCERYWFNCQYLQVSQLSIIIPDILQKLLHLS